MNVTFTYRNHRGIVRTVRALNGHVWQGSTEHHPEPQALLTAWDLDRAAWRTYALAQVIAWNMSVTP